MLDHPQLPCLCHLGSEDFLSIRPLFSIMYCCVGFDRFDDENVLYNHRTVQKDKLPVLHRLEREIPKFLVCYICHILHECDGSKCFGLSGSVYDQEK